MNQSNERIPICIVGCGGMGHRHTIAYHTLEETGLSNIELMAVCDLRRENAERVAGEEQGYFTEMTIESEAFRASRQTVPELYAEAHTVRADFRRKSPWFGAFLGLVYGAIVGAVVGWLVAWIYNRVAGRPQNHL